MPLRLTSVAIPMPSACTPMRLSSGSCGEPARPNHQRASYSRKPEGLITACVSKPKVLGLARLTGAADKDEVPPNAGILLQTWLAALTFASGLGQAEQGGTHIPNPMRQ